MAGRSCWRKGQELNRAGFQGTLTRFEVRLRSNLALPSIAYGCLLRNTVDIDDSRVGSNQPSYPSALFTPTIRFEEKMTDCTTGEEMMWRSHREKSEATNGFRLRCRLPLTQKRVNHPRFPTRHGHHLLYDCLLPLVDPALSRFTSDRAARFSQTPPPSQVFLQATHHSSTLFWNRRLIQFARWPVPLFFGDSDVEPHGRFQPCDPLPLPVP